ncbi:ABC transporter ATP-binding protein [Mycobacteroides immunogenum]|uniref:ABC transporter ATP-binding protein n=1 Tax=Mycobacteroides immunogenum TaxID=83262 RepID=A0A179VH85_9MYCO|nr:AarF/ABC1/UbiB kinase family protein [Mycobacteroides immunogenum]OAT70381.1 ABC transporter ATP-binding protein [Mycobacteroides immunogenum]
MPLRAKRAAALGKVVAGQAVRSAITTAIKPISADVAARRDADILRFADDLAAVAGSMKGAAQKLGQLLSVVDVGITSASVRDEFTARLAPLFDNAPRVPDAAMHTALDRELGELRSRIESIDAGAIASASIGQVYRGRLDDGRMVAIKIQYPDIASKVRADLKNLQLVVKLAARKMPASNAQAVVAEVQRQMLKEVDYRTELAHHQRIFDAFRGHPAWIVPQPISELCTERVLVTEYLDGTPFDGLVGADQSIRNQVGEAIYRFYCGEMYRTGFFCADPHPGNIMLLPDGRVGFVDFGLCMDMDPQDAEVQRQVFRALLAGDDEEAFQLAVAAGFLADPEAMDRGAAIEYIRSISSWHLVDGQLRMSPEIARRSVADAVLPSSKFYDGIRNQRLVETHAMARRTEMCVAALLGKLGAEAPWSQIAREYLGMSAVATAMGADIENWSQQR